MVCDHRGTEDSAGKGKPAVKGGTAAASALVRLNLTKLSPKRGKAHRLVLVTKRVGPHTFFLLCIVSFCCFPCVGSGTFLMLC